MTHFTFNTTPNLICKPGAMADIGALKPLLGEQVLFVTDPGIIKLGLHKEAVQNLINADIDVLIFDQVEADPKASIVELATQIAIKHQTTGVIGFGGGSSMDVAKLVALLAKGAEKLEDIYGIDMIKGSRIPLIQIPTTAGTGSEVTPISIITVGAETKKGVVSSKLLPDVAILDVDGTYKLTLVTDSHSGSGFGLNRKPGQYLEVRYLGL